MHLFCLQPLRQLQIYFSGAITGSWERANDLFCNLLWLLDGDYSFVCVGKWKNMAKKGGVFFCFFLIEPFILHLTWEWWVTQWSRPFFGLNLRQGIQQPFEYLFVICLLPGLGLLVVVLLWVWFSFVLLLGWFMVVCWLVFFWYRLMCFHARAEHVSVRLFHLTVFLLSYHAWNEVSKCT